MPKRRSGLGKDRISLAVLAIIIVAGVLVFSVSSTGAAQRPGQGAAGQKDAIRPTVTITPSPANPGVDEKVKFDATASDNIGVSEIKIYTAAGKTPAKTCNIQPPSAKASCTYETTYTKIGTYPYSAAASDARGNKVKDPKTGFKTINVTDKTPPNVSVSHSPANPNINQLITITAKASDNIGLDGSSGIELYVDGTKNKACSASPCVVQVIYYTDGTHTYYAQAKDTAGNIARDPASGTKNFFVWADKPPNASVVAGKVYQYTGGPFIGIDFNASAKDDVELSGMIVSYYRANNSTVVQQQCSFSGKTSGECSNRVRWPQTANDTYSYWVKAWDSGGRSIRAPENGEYTITIKWP